MSEPKEYVVLARLPDDRDIKSSVHAHNLQQAVKLAVKLLPPRAAYRAVSIVEVMESVDA